MLQRHSSERSEVKESPLNNGAIDDSEAVLCTEAKILRRAGRRMTIIKSMTERRDVFLLDLVNDAVFKKER